MIEVHGETAHLAIEDKVVDDQRGATVTAEQLRGQSLVAGRDCNPAGYHRGDERPRREVTTELTEEHEFLDRTEANTATRLRDAEREPTDVGAAFPCAIVDRQRSVAVGEHTDLGQGQFVGEELLGNSGDLELFGGEGEVHHRGNPNARSPMMFFWMSLVPPAMPAENWCSQYSLHMSSSSEDVPRTSMARRPTLCCNSPQKVRTAVVIGEGGAPGFDSATLR